jgi:hypothetical protein
MAIFKKDLDSDKHKPSSQSQSETKDVDAVAVNNEDVVKQHKKHYHVAEAAAGDKSNDDVTRCRICASNGWPHEPIDFEKIPGRMLADGTLETADWKLKNYYSGEPHEHKQWRRY